MGKGYHAIDVDPKEHFHLALDGHAFSVIKEYYPDLFNRVGLYVHVHNIGLYVHVYNIGL